MSKDKCKCKHGQPLTTIKLTPTDLVVLNQLSGLLDGLTTHYEYILNNDPELALRILYLANVMPKSSKLFKKLHDAFVEHESDIAQVHSETVKEVTQLSMQHVARHIEQTTNTIYQ